MTRSRLLLTLSLLVGLIGIPVRAQSPAGSGVFPPVSEDYQVLWTRVEALCQDENWEAVFEGLKEYSTLFERPDLNVVISNGAGTALGLRPLLRRYIARMPEPFRERLTVLSDRAIARAWSDTRDELETRRRERLRHAIVRDYPFSSFHRAALEEEVDAGLLSGNWRRARIACERLIDRTARAESDVPLEDRLKAHLCLLQVCRALGDPARWKQTHDALATLVADKNIDVKTVHPAYGGQLRAALDASYEPLNPEASPGRIYHALSPLAPRVPAADATRDGRDEDGAKRFRLGGVVWRSESPGSNLRQFVSRRSTARDGARRPGSNVPLPYFPAAHDSVIVFQHDHRVVAFDAGAERELWTFLLPPSHTPYNIPRTPTCSQQICFLSHGNTLSALALRSGQPRWQRAVHYDVETRRLQFAAETRAPPGPTNGATETDADAETDAETEKDAADAADAADGGEPRRIPVHDLSPATFYDGDLVICAMARLERESASFLVRLSPDGEVRWSTFLGSSQSHDYLGLGATCSPPRIVDDTVVALSNQGFLATVDARDGTISWIVEYPTLSSRAIREAIRDENRWHVNPVLPVSPDGVLVAPQDSPYLFAVRRHDGAVVWRHRREHLAFLLGHDGARCYLAGGQISAVSLHGASRGKVVWSQPLNPATDRPLGRGLLLPDRLLLSTHDALIHVDPTTGRVRSREPWEFPGGGGNLLRTEDKLAVIYPGGFLVYNEYDDEARRIASLSPDASETVLRQVMFHLKAGALEKSLTRLEAWATTRPEKTDVNAPLDRLHLELTDVLTNVTRTADPGLTSRLLRARVHVERLTRRKVEAAIALARHLTSQGKRAESLAAWHWALALDTPPTTTSPDGRLLVSSEATVRNAIQTLRRSDPRPDETFARVEREAMAALKEAYKSGRERGIKSSIAYLDLLRRYPYTQAAAQAYLDLATFYGDYENYEHAARYLLEYLDDFPDSEDRVRIGLQAGQYLYLSGQRSEAKRHYLALLEAFPDARVTGIRGLDGRETVRDYVARRLSDPGLAEVDVDNVKALRFPARMIWRSPADLVSTNRIFLRPEGEPPSPLGDCFFTQSGETIQCRDLETGLPLWILHLRMIPGFVPIHSRYGLHFARSGDEVIKGQFVGSLLVLYDHSNVFAVDSLTGVARWHIPFGDGKKRDGEKGPSLRERICGAVAREKGIFITTSWKRLYRYGLEGELVWEQKLDYYPAFSTPPFDGGDHVYVLEQPSPKLHGYTVPTGASLGVFSKAFEKDVRSVDLKPVPVGNGTLLIPFNVGTSAHLRLVDLKTRKIRWSYTRPRSNVSRLFYFATHPDEVILAQTLSNNQPVLAAFSLRDGRERWRYERPSTEPITMKVYRDKDRVYVILGPSGGTNWRLVALKLSRGADRGRNRMLPIWKPRETPLGMFLNSRRIKLHICQDSVLFPDPNSICVYDKYSGQTRGPAQDMFSRFLVEKGSFTSGIFCGKLVLITDGGDCAFATLPRTDARQLAQQRLESVHTYLARPADTENIIRLALSLFRDGNRDGVQSAVNLLDRALLSENVLSQASPRDREELKFLLDGLKEEALKKAPKTQIIARRLWKPPVVDGRLDDAYNCADQVRLATPRHIGQVGGPTQTGDWEGEEDLSAILYTGWDNDYFYFALDVDDDVLRAYDKDAREWKGDCLLIGVDPDDDGGYRQGPRDQLMTLALTIPKRNRKMADDAEDPEGDEEGGDDDDDDDDTENQPEGKFSVMKKDDNSGAIYEVGLPWSSFSEQFKTGGRPPRGYSFGLSLLLTDDDTGTAATKTLSINPCHLLPRHQKSLSIWKFLIPEFFPRVRLR